MASAAELAIVIRAKNEATAAFQKVSSDTEGLGKQLKGLAVAAAGALGAFVGFQQLKGAVEKTQEMAGEVSKLRRELGVTPEEASKLNYAIKRVGLTVDEVAPSFGIFQRNLVHAKDALQDGVDISKNFGVALAKLGLSELATNATSQNMISVIDQVADRFKLMKDGAEKNTIAMDLFGRSGRDLIPLLNLGSEGLRQMAEDAEKLGVVLTTKNLEQVKALTIAQRELDQASAGLKLTFGFALIPAFKGFTQMLVDAQPVVRGFISEGIATLSRRLGDLAKLLAPVRSLFDGLRSKAEALRPVLASISAVVASAAVGIVIFGPGIAAVIPLLGVLVAAFGALLSPVTLLVVGVAALAIVFRGPLAAGAKAAASFVGSFGDEVKTLIAIVRGAAAIAKTGFLSGFTLGDAPKNVTRLQDVMHKLGGAIRTVVAVAAGAALIFKTGFLAGITGGDAPKNVTRLQEAAFKLGQVLRAVGKEVMTWGPIVRDLATNVLDIAMAFGRWLIESGLLGTFLAGLKTGVGLTALSFKLLYDMIKPLIEFIASHKAVLIALAVALGIVLVVMNPIPAAILAIILAIGFLSQHWDEIKAKTLEVWRSIGAFIDERLGFIKAIVIDVARIVQLYVQNWMDTIRDIVRIAMALLHGDWGEAWDGIKNLVSDRLTFIKDILGAQFALIRDLMSAPFSAAKDIIFGIFEGIKNIVTGAVNFMIDRINDLLEAARKIDRALPEAISPWDVPGNIPHVGGGATDWSQVVGIAHGGGMVPGPLGANRLILAQGGERVLTPAQQRSGGGTVNITNHFEINADMTEGTVEKLIRRVTDAQDAALRRTGLQGSFVGGGVFSP